MRVAFQFNIKRVSLFQRLQHARWVFQVFGGIYVLVIEQAYTLVLNLNPHHLLLAKRLLVASMACVVVWQVAHSELSEAQEFLIKLSGRQMKRDKPVTWLALFSGLWVLLSMLEVLEGYTLNELYKIRDQLRKISPALAKLVVG